MIMFHSENLNTKQSITLGGLGLPSPMRSSIKRVSECVKRSSFTQLSEQRDLIGNNWAFRLVKPFKIKIKNSFFIVLN